MYMYMYMCVYIYIYIYMSGGSLTALGPEAPWLWRAGRRSGLGRRLYIYIYIYMYREREREIDR